ncbi:hypothetical protein FHG87_009079 [Trinorchestia longiramus]|nr:hypothetical protein FHG87_009079 [Trinorchestia longiramus]
MQTIEAAGGLICDTHVTVLSEETVVEDVVCEQKYYDDRNYEFEFAQPATNNNSVEYTGEQLLVPLSS